MTIFISLKRVMRSGVLRVLRCLDCALSFMGWHSRGIAVLMYHSVADGEWELSIPPAVFESHISLLKRTGYELLTLERFQRIMNGKEPMPERSVLITFDDGYRDFLDAAVPILKKDNAPSVVFIHANRSSDELGNNFPLLSWDDIRRVRHEGVAIGAHSYAHSNLKKLSPTALDDDINNAETVFRRELGDTPSVFAYPGGKFSQAVIDTLKQHGYTRAFTISEGLVAINGDPFRLPRLGITRNTSLWEFRVKLTRVAGWYESLRHMI